jgi:hypothetical protein
MMKSELKFGAIIALIGFVWNCLEYLLGFHTSNIDWHLFISLAFPIVIIAGVILGTKSILGTLSPNVPKRIFNRGFKITLFAAIFSVILGFLFYQFVNPTFFDDMKIAGREWIMMSASSEDEAANSIIMMEDAFSMKAHLTLGFIFTVITGILGSLISVVTLKKS